MARAQATPERIRLMERVIERITELRKGSLHPLDTGTPTVTLKMPDGGFKRKPLFGGYELVFSGGYVGKSGQPNFVFEPSDERDWKQAEFNLKELDVAMPLFGAELSSEVDIDEEKMPVLFEKMLQKFAADDILAADAEKRAAQETYKNNPLFGRF